MTPDTRRLVKHGQRVEGEIKAGPPFAINGKSGGIIEK